MATTPKPLVILADDDENVLRSMRIVLAPICRLSTFNRAAPAVTAVHDHNPSAVILDIRMPDHDGFWAFAQIREFNKMVPIIFNSAFQSELPTDDVNARFKPFGSLPKNGNVKEFIALVKAALAEGTR